MRGIKKMMSYFLTITMAFDFVIACPIADKEVSAATEVTLSPLQEQIVKYASRFKGKTREEVGLPDDEWCGYYVDYILKLSYRYCGYDNYKDYYPSSDMPSATKIAQYIEDDTRWADYYSWTEWEYGGKSSHKTDNRDDYYPEVGDILTINWFSRRNTLPQHIAIIIKVNDDGSFVTSEGNTRRDVYDRDNSPVIEYTYTKTYEKYDELVYGRYYGGVVCAVRPFDPTKPEDTGIVELLPSTANIDLYDSKSNSANSNLQINFEDDAYNGNEYPIEPPKEVDTLNNLFRYLLISNT